MSNKTLVLIIKCGNEWWECGYDPLALRKRSVFKGTQKGMNVIVCMWLVFILVDNVVRSEATGNMAVLLVVCASQHPVPVRHVRSHEIMSQSLNHVFGRCLWMKGGAGIFGGGPERASQLLGVLCADGRYSPVAIESDKNSSSTFSFILQMLAVGKLNLHRHINTSTFG